MTSKWQWLLRQFSRQLWVRATFFCLLGIATAFLAVLLSPYIPDGLEAAVGAEAVDNILGIIASSMLTVTTFSLSTMVAAYSAATNSVTPRATKLLMADTTTQNVLATFIGSFLFSLVGIIALSMEVYGEEGRVVLFAVTILVIALIVITLLRWIDHLSKLGRVGETTATVEKATRQALEQRVRTPYLGGVEFKRGQSLPHGARPIICRRIGYVQHIDIAHLSSLADDKGGQVIIAALPGRFVTPAEPVAYLVGKVAAANEDEANAILKGFTIAQERSFKQDPRFGLSVLAEIASRALSPAVNDPGTAIDVIGRAVRLLSVWADTETAEEPLYPNVFVPAIHLEDLYDDVFTPITRDWAGLVEVQMRLQKAFAALSEFGGAPYAQQGDAHSRTAMARMRHAGVVDHDLKVLEDYLKGSALPR
jgi:uncharacterized membrane protein